MKLRLAVLGLVLLGVAACSSSGDKEEAEIKQPVPICPQVAVLRDLELIRDYGNEKPDPAELVAQAKMRGVEGDCAYRKDGIDVKFNLLMAAERGPRLGGLSAGFPYFVAVVGPDETILNKDRMTMEFGFSSEDKLSLRSESLRVFIPLAKADWPTGPHYRVLMGFQLNEEQLAAARGKK